MNGIHIGGKAGSEMTLPFSLCFFKLHEAAEPVEKPLNLDFPILQLIDFTRPDFSGFDFFDRLAISPEF